MLSSLYLGHLRVFNDILVVAPNHLDPLDREELLRSLARSAGGQPEFL
jgi:hypothetical protein